MKKYHVIDADGEEYQVEELDEEIEAEEIKAEPEAPVLASEEIEALKKLAAVADKLIGLLPTEDADEDMDENVLQDEDAEIEEEVIDTDEEEERMPARDSKKSFGAIEKKNSVVTDSLIDDVADAWAKRYGGNK